MNTWTFNLQEEARLPFRQGIHGLYRLLRHGEGHECYPEVRQTDTLSWEYDDTTITIQWDSHEDLERLMAGMLGDFRHGVGVPPGYETSPDRPGFYASARAHTAINASLFREKRGACRSRSLSGVVDLYRADHPHLDIRTEVSCLQREGDSDKPLLLKFQPHCRPDAWTKPGQKPGEPLTLKKNFGNVYHPFFGKWNDQAIKCTEQENFIVSFACLSFAYTMHSNGFTGLALDFPTFGEADEHHAWFAKHPMPWVGGSERLAAWAIATKLNLPSGTYMVVSDTAGVFLFSTRFPARDTDMKFREILEAATVQVKSTENFISRISMIPVRNMGSSKEPKFVSVLDQILHNLEGGLNWAHDLEDVFTVPRGSDMTGLYPKEFDTMQTIAKIMSSDKERLLQEGMRQLYLNVATAYKGFGEKRWQMTTDFVVKTHLNRVVNFETLLRAIDAITQKGGWPPSDEWYQALWEVGSEHPLLLKSHLCLACRIKIPKTVKAEEAGEPEEPEEPKAPGEASMEIEELLGLP